MLNEATTKIDFKGKKYKVEKVINTKFVVGNFIGNGSFSAIFDVQDR